MTQTASPAMTAAGDYVFSMRQHEPDVWTCVYQVMSCVAAGGSKYFHVSEAMVEAGERRYKELVTARTHPKPTWNDIWNEVYSAMDDVSVRKAMDEEVTN